MTHQKFLFTPLIYLFSIWLIISGSVWGQFSVISTNPAHGAAGVDTSVSFSISFNAPIDTAARFPFPTDFFLNLFLYPDTLVGEPDSITYSPDLSTVYIHNPHFYPNTDYFFVIGDAISQWGDSLAMPFPLLFTTAGSLSSATVSGTIIYAGNDPTGTLVALLAGPPFGEEGESVNGTVIGTSGGNYSVDYVAPGTYWPAAVSHFFVNGEGSIEPLPGSGLGFYDADGDYTPDSIIVTTGAQITGIDFSLETIFPQTARDPYPLIESLAHAWATDAILVGVGAGEVEPDGYSLSWQYGFFSPTLMQQRAWMALGSFVVSIPVFTSPADTQEISQNWLNSDTVMAISEAHGGAEFRLTYPDAEIYALMGYLNFGEEENIPRLLKKQWNESSPLLIHTNAGRQTFFQGLPDSGAMDFSRSLPAAWVVQYNSPSTGAELFLLLDVETGVVLNEPTTARIAEAAAFPVAQNWSADVKLWAIISQGSHVDSLGRTQFWNLLYYSPLIDSLHAVVVWGQLPVLSGPQAWIWSDTSTIAPNWLDSDVSIAVAEAAGGAAYRGANQSVHVSAFLSRWYHAPYPGSTVWAFEYTSSTSPPLELLVDALTGALVGIGENNLPEVPDRFVLEQNSPNPFNSLTTIRYRLPARVDVRLEIFDVRGMQVAKLVDTIQNSGYYSVKWDGSTVSSGLYFYRLTAGKFINTRKLILIK